MTDHFTTLRKRADDMVVAWCPEHHSIGLAQRPTQHGFNAVITEARAHDDQVHAVMRTVKQYRVALAIEAQELRAAQP
jgi:hypothetical protein